MFAGGCTHDHDSVAARSKRPARPAADARHGLGRMTSRILIVDDHAMVAMALQVSFVALGWEVEVVNAQVAAEVTRRVEDYQPDCVLLDLNLGSAPHTGVDLISPICSLGASVVMLTGETDRHELARCVQAGVLGWISKQAPLDEVIERVLDVSEGGLTDGGDFQGESAGRAAHAPDAQLTGHHPLPETHPA